jgi:hypothetical protein
MNANRLKLVRFLVETSKHTSVEERLRQKWLDELKQYQQSSQSQYSAVAPQQDQHWTK